MNLTTLANEAGSDKGDKVFHAHGYSSLYSFLFERFRTEHFAMLEMGLERGCIDPDALKVRVGVDIPSVKMWSSYFPNAKIYGFDISDFSHITADRFSFFRGDMGNPTDLQKLRKTLPKMRIVVDDASHAAYHQQLAFATLFDKVESGGYYVIEDLHASHPIEASLPQVTRTAKVIEDYLVTGVLDMPFIQDHQLSSLVQSIQNVHVHRNDRGGVSRLTLKMVAFQKK